MLRTLADAACDRDLLLDYVIARLKFHVHRWQVVATHIPRALQAFLAILISAMNMIGRSMNCERDRLVERHFYAGMNFLMHRRINYQSARLRAPGIVGSGRPD